MATRKQQETYETIMQLYDMAEALVDTADAANLSEEEEDARLALVEPLVVQLADATDVLVREYTTLVRQGKSIDPLRKQKLEQALSRIFAIVEECRQYSKGDK